MLLPFIGALVFAFSPRTMPWAGRLCLSRALTDVEVVAVQGAIVVWHGSHGYLLFLLGYWLLDSLRLLWESLMLGKYFHHLLDDWVVHVDVLGPSLLIQHVVDDSAVDIAVEQLMALANQEVAALQASLVGVVGELLHHVLAVEIVGELHHFLEIVQFRTVVVSVGECKLEDESAHACLLEV